MKRRARTLTPRQRDVLGLIAAGLSRKQIAERLNVTEQAIKNHVLAIAKRLPGDGQPFRRVRLYARELCDQGRTAA